MELKDAILKRRSYRSLDPAEIADTVLDELADAAGMAPSCYNKQPWRYVCVYENDVLDELKKSLSSGNEWALDASMIIAVCSKPDMDCRLKDGRDYYLFDTGMSVAFMMLKATELALVCHAIAGYDPGRVKDTLKIPEDMEVVTLLIVGRHSDDIKPSLSEKQAESEKERPPRSSIEDIIYRNAYGN